MGGRDAFEGLLKPEPLSAPMLLRAFFSKAAKWKKKITKKIYFCACYHRLLLPEHQWLWHSVRIRYRLYSRLKPCGDLPGTDCIHWALDRHNPAYKLEIYTCTNNGCVFLTGVCRWTRFVWFRQRNKGGDIYTTAGSTKWESFVVNRITDRLGTGASRLIQVQSKNSSK